MFDVGLNIAFLGYVLNDNKNAFLKECAMHVHVIGIFCPRWIAMLLFSCLRFIPFLTS